MKLICENIDKKVEAIKLLLILPESLENKRFVYIFLNIKIKKNCFLLLSPPLLPMIHSFKHCLLIHMSKRHV